MQLCNCRILVIREDVIAKSLMTLAWLTSLANIGFIYRNVGTINTYSQEPMKNVHGRFQYQSQGWSTWRVIFARACHRVLSISSISGSCILFTTACVDKLQSTSKLFTIRLSVFLKPSERIRLLQKLNWTLLFFPFGNRFLINLHSRDSVSLDTKF